MQALCNQDLGLCNCIFFISPLVWELGWSSKLRKVSTILQFDFFIFFKGTHNKRSKLRIKLGQKIYLQAHYDLCGNLYIFWLPIIFHLQEIPGPVLESKCMGAIFQKKGKKMLTKGKIFANLGKNIWKYFEKRQVMACNNPTQ